MPVHMAFSVPDGRVSTIADSESFGGDGDGSGPRLGNHCASMEEN